jgi:WD40 repeat protein
VGGVAFSPDGRLLASASYDSTVRLWEVATRKPLATLRGHDKHVRALAFTPDGRILATGGWDRLIRLWDMGTRRQIGTLLAHHTYEVWCIAISPDGRLLASGTPSQDRRSIRLFDLQTRRLVTWLSGHDQYALAVAFNPRGDVLASGGTDHVVRLWRVADFWPQPAARSQDDPGALLRDYLEHPPYTLDGMDKLIGEIERLTGFRLVGTVAMPITQPR